MTEIDRVFELMHGANRSFRTVRAIIRVWRDEEVHQRAFERHFEQMQQDQGGRSGISVMVGVSESGESEPKETEETLRLWIEQPWRRREETEGRSSRLTVSDGEKTWSYAPEWGAMEHEDVGDAGGEASFLFEPAGLLPGLALKALEETQWVGRPVIRVRARPHARVHDTFLSHAPGADEHELLVDAERGVLLRTTSHFEGSVFAITEVTEIAFDEVLDPKIFTFEPPEGETIRRPEDLGMDHDVTIEQAAERASFRVWVASDLPRAEGTRFRPDWEVEVLYQPGLERPRMPEMVVMFCHHDTLGSVTIHERAAETALEARPPWESLELDGVRVLVLEPSSQRLPVPTQVRLQREGTEIDISSAEVDRDSLIAVARSLVPAPTGPPSFS